MKSASKKLLTVASVLAIGVTAGPAMAWGPYDNYTRVPLHGYAPNYGGYSPFNGYSPYNGSYGGFNGFNNDSYYRHARARRVLKTTLVGAGIGAGAGALVGLAGREGRVLRPALIGGGIGAGVGLGYGLLTHPRYGYLY
jgi:hypothetical protein